MPKVALSQTDLFYTDDGIGQPLVFIHGLGASHHMFEPQIETFRKTHRVICPETRGNGGSGKLTGPVATVLDRQCDDVAELLDRLGIPKVVMCGVSYGGVFVFHFALRHPERLAGIVIVDSFGDTHPSSGAEWLLMAFQWAAFWVYYLPPRWLVPSVRAQYKRWPLAQAQIVRIMLNMRRHETILQRLAINSADHTKELEQVRCPALGIVGDATDLGQRYMRRSVPRIHGARVEVVADSFDPTNLCQREMFDRLLAGFLTEIGW